MDGILEAIEYIIDIIETVIDLVFMLVESMFTAINYLPEMTKSLTESIVYLPPVLGMFATLFVTFMVVNYIIGRN